MSGLSRQNNKNDDFSAINTSEGKTLTKKKRKSNEDMLESDTKGVKLQNTKRKKSESPNRETTTEKQHSTDRLCQTTSSAFDNSLSSALTVSNISYSSSRMDSSSSSYYISSDEEDSCIPINVRKSIATTNLTQEVATSMVEDSNSNHSDPSPSALKQDGEKMINQEKFEEELKCSICSEIFIRAVTLNCSHSFCKYCIMKWRKDHTTCPICRQAILNQNSTLVLDKCVERVLECFETDALTRRQEIVDFRDKNYDPEPQIDSNPDLPPNTDPQVHGSFSISDLSEEFYDDDDEFYDYQDFDWEDEVYSPSLGNSIASDDYGDLEGDVEDVSYDSETEELEEIPIDEAEDEDDEVVDRISGEEDYCDDEASSDDNDLRNVCFNCGQVGHMARHCPTAVAYTGTPGAYFGGYGSCFKCNQQGHWANGCPN